MNNPTPDDATIEAMDLRLEIAELEVERAVLRARVADLEAQANGHAEALVIAHGIGSASRNGEARRFLRELAEVLAERDAECAARKDAESRLWDSQRLKDNYSSELKVVIGERDASKALLADAQIYVREVARENAAGWGGRLMHKQQPAINCDAAITAFLEGQK